MQSGSSSRFIFSISGICFTQSKALEKSSLARMTYSFSRNKSVNFCGRSTRVTVVDPVGRNQCWLTDLFANFELSYQSNLLSVGYKRSNCLNCFPSASIRVDQINLDSLPAKISTALVKRVKRMTA